MVGLNPVRGLLSTPAGQQKAGGGFEAYAAGAKHYGTGVSAPNIGKTANKVGYGQRDGAMASRRDAYLERMKRFS